MGYLIKVIDTETGIYEEMYDKKKPEILTQDYINMKRMKHKNALKKSSKISKTRYIKNFNKEVNSNFIFMIYQYCKKKKNLDQADLTRLIYLATFVRYDGILAYDNFTLLTKKNVNELIFKLCDESFYNLYNKLIKQKIIKEIDGNLYLNKSHFFKGNIEDHKGYIMKRNYIRLYIDVIRYLYMNVSVKHHKKLGVIFALIPYINRYHNILCLNPDEANIDLVKPLVLGDLSEILGYDQKYLFSLKKDLLSIKLNDGKNVIVFVEKNPDRNSKQIIINPMVIYGDSEPEYAYKLMQRYF